MSLSNSRIFPLHWTLTKRYSCFKLVHFSKKSGCLSSAGPESLAFGSHSLAKFQPILDCFIPNFKLKYEDSENVKADSVNTVVFNSHKIKRRAFLGHPVGQNNFITSQSISVALSFKPILKVLRKGNLVIGYFKLVITWFHGLFRINSLGKSWIVQK